MQEERKRGREEERRRREEQRKRGREEEKRGTKEKFFALVGHGGGEAEGKWIFTKAMSTRKTATI